MKQFYQCDVAESSSDSIWTGPVVYTETPEEAEFLTMLELQQDWGDGYMPDSFLEAFGGSGDYEREFPGVEAWKVAEYWDDAFRYSAVTANMLTVDTVTALAKLGKIECDLPSDVIDAALTDQAQLHVVVNMRGSEPVTVPGLNEAWHRRETHDGTQGSAPHVLTEGRWRSCRRDQSSSRSHVSAQLGAHRQRR
jgi:hypothetical protein